MQKAVSQGRRERHVPVRNVSHVYWSRRANGSKVFEVRHPKNVEGHRPYEVVGPRLDEAKARAREIYGSDRRVTNIAMTVDQAHEKAGPVWEAELKQRTLENYEDKYRLYIRPRWGRARVRDVRALDMQVWLNGLKRQDNGQPLSQGVKETIRIVLQIVLDFAVEAGALASNPARQPVRGSKRQKRKKLPARILSLEEQPRLLAACKRLEWIEPIILTALLAALRKGEVLGLRRCDVDFEYDLLWIRQQLHKDGRLGSPKGDQEGNEPKSVPLHPELKRIIRETMFAASDKRGEAPVFQNTLGSYRRYGDIDRAWQKVRARAGLSEKPRRLRFHDLRHTACSRAANAPGASLPNVQKFLRHETLQTTLGYVHAIPDAEANERMFTALSTGGTA